MQKNSDDIVIFLLASTTIILIMVCFVITIVLLYRKKQITHQKNIDSLKTDYEKTILNSRIEMQEQTFQNISREIHDNIGISLTLAKLNLNTLDLDNALNLREQVNSSIELVSKAISDLSDISQSLNADYIADYGLINSLQQEISKLKKLGLHDVEFDVSGNAIFLEIQKELIIFRITQEALNNILKHAKAKKIQVHLSYEAKSLNLKIHDNGIGFNIDDEEEVEDKKKGTGLINMRKRAEMIHGQWSIRSKRSEGTLVILTVPY